MRLNKYIALHTSHSRRKADDLIAANRVKINNQAAIPGQIVAETDTVFIDGTAIKVGGRPKSITIILNKPPGYVCSRDGQGSPTVYELLPAELHQLNYAGRLDKDSSGLLVLTSDGELANQLTHPRYEKTKVYEIKLNKPLQPLHQQIISDKGISLDDGVSKFQVEKIGKSGQTLRITMREGRNRQIRRTFESLGYFVNKLHRVTFGLYDLEKLPPAGFKQI